jgi:hypothetical protein
MIAGSPLFQGLGLASGMGEAPTTGDPTPAAPPSASARIPLPDYKNPESRLAYAKQFANKYGPLMSGRGDTPLRINEIPAWGKASSKQLAIQSAQKLGLDPALLYSSAMEEGMSGIFPHKFQGREKEGDLVQSSGNKDFPISGYINFGLDTFTNAYPGLVKKGYLPNDFQNNFMPADEMNEKNERVKSANFKSPEAALQAKAAMMRAGMDTVDEISTRNKIQLSPKAKSFFNLIGYNAGFGNAEKMLKEYASNGYLKDDAFLKKRPSAGWQQPYENIIRRIQMADALRSEGYFDDQLPQQMAAPVAAKRN